MTNLEIDTLSLQDVGDQEGGVVVVVNSRAPSVTLAQVLASETRETMAGAANDAARGDDVAA